MSSSDEDLLKRSVEGDMDALSELLERHGPEIRRVLASEIPRRWRAVLTADDVMQETFVDAFLAISRFQARGITGFVRWLKTLAERNLIDAVRMLEAEKRRGDHKPVGRPAEDALLALYERLTGTPSTPSRQAAQQEARVLVRQAIERLPEAQRTLVSMRFPGGKSLEEVASAVNRSPGAVCMQIRRALDRLRDYLGPSYWYLSG